MEHMCHFLIAEDVNIFNKFDQFLFLEIIMINLKKISEDIKK